MYPQKGTKEYDEMCKKNRERAKEIYEKLKNGSE